MNHEISKENLTQNQFPKEDYKGSPSTLCKGCGHDNITSSIINACYELQVAPSSLIKLSGIGCSSKTPNYFLEKSFGFNSIHGRMAALATGVHLSLPKAKLIGVSGDGDTASIGLSGFLHMIRRNVPIVYIIADNGVYGLTKGQFSATSQQGDQLTSKKSQIFDEINCLKLALDAGGEFLARAFSGDAVQLKKIIQTALLHQGTSVIQVISPCVAYGNHDGYSKSYTLNQEIKTDLNDIDLILEPQELDEQSYKIIPLKEGYDHTSFKEAESLFFLETQEQKLHTGIVYASKTPRPPLNTLLKRSAESKFSLEEYGLSTEAFHSIQSEFEI